MPCATCCLCGASCSGRIKHCSRCKVAIYCSSSCQSIHWDTIHQRVCRPLVPTLIITASRAPTRDRLTLLPFALRELVFAFVGSDAYAWQRLGTVCRTFRHDLPVLAAMHRVVTFENRNVWRGDDGVERTVYLSLADRLCATVVTYSEHLVRLCIKTRVSEDCMQILVAMRRPRLRRIEIESMDHDVRGMRSYLTSLLRSPVLEEFDLKTTGSFALEDAWGWLQTNFRWIPGESNACVMLPHMKSHIDGDAKRVLSVFCIACDTMRTVAPGDKIRRCHQCKAVACGPCSATWVHASPSKVVCKVCHSRRPSSRDMLNAIHHTVC